MSCPAPGRAVGPGRLDLVSRVRSLLARRRSNIVPSHGDVISDTAKARNEVILMRPVNQYSTGLIADNYATKGMGIKGKSSDWGPHAGTIPVDPKLSKLGNPTAAPPTPNELRLYENYNKKALGEPYETPIKDDLGNVSGWEQHEAVPALAKKVQVEGPDGKMIEVLGDPQTGRPITADYDLFAVGNERGPGAAFPIDPKTGKPRMHDEMGGITANEMVTADAINGGVKTAGYEGGNVVHHGAANRFENALNPKSDFPITAFTPDGNVHTLANPDELNDFYNTWNKLGYNLEAMPGWGLDPNRVPTGKFAPLAENVSLANRAAAAGIVVTAQGVGECDELESDSVDLVDPTITPLTTETSGRATTGGGATGGGGAGSGSVLVTGGTGGFTTIDPVYFEFGSGTQVEDPPPYWDPERFIGDKFWVEVEQVFTVTGNNPFDPRDPLADGQNQLRRIISEPRRGPVITPPGGGPGPVITPGGSNPFTDNTGNYSGNSGCGFSLTRLGTSGNNVVTLTLTGNGTARFDIDTATGNANSQGNNLTVLGDVGHSCQIFNVQNNSFTLFCFRPGASCTEPFSR